MLNISCSNFVFKLDLIFNINTELSGVFYSQTLIQTPSLKPGERVRQGQHAYVDMQKVGDTGKRDRSIQLSTSEGLAGVWMIRCHEMKSGIRVATCQWLLQLTSLQRST